MWQDIIIDTNNDIQFLNGDFFVGDSGDQHIQNILQANKGQYYESPLVGVGLINYKGSPFTRPELKREIREQLLDDQRNIKVLTLGNSLDQINLEIDAPVKETTNI